MTRWFGLIMGAALALGVTRATCAAELRNGSFEEEGEAPDRAAGWARWGDWFNRETGWRPTREGKCVLVCHHARINKGASSGVWQDVHGVSRGAQVTFSVYISADRAKTGEDDFDAVELRLETTLYGEQATVASRRWPAGAIESDGHWSRLVLRSVAPTESLRVLLIVYPSIGKKPRGGAVKFDEARLEMDPPPRTVGGVPEFIFSTCWARTR